MRGSEPGELLKIVVALLENQVLPVVETHSGRARPCCSASAYWTTSPSASRSAATWSTGSG